MIQQFKQYLANILKYKSVERQPTEAQAILGNDTKIAAFADFWEKYASDLQVLTVVKLHEYEMTAFTKEGLDGFIEGSAIVGAFLKMCWDERESKKSPPVSKP